MEIEADSAKQGLKSAVAELFDPAEPLPGSESQQLMLPALPLEAGDDAAAAERRRGPGRPAGAKNKNTEAWRNFILSRHRSPLEALAMTFNMTIADLAARLGLKNPPTFDQALELFKVQMTAARDLAPYVHQKMPLAIEGEGGGGLIQLVINQGQAAQQGVQEAGATAFKVLNTPTEQNQLVTDADFKDSNKTQSNENGESHDKP